MVRGRLCAIMVPNAHALNDTNSQKSKDSFYEEPEQVFDQLHK